MTTASGTTPRGWPTRRHLLAGGLAAAALSLGRAAQRRDARPIPPPAATLDVTGTHLRRRAQRGMCHDQACLIE